MSSLDEMDEDIIDGMILRLRELIREDSGLKSIELHFRLAVKGAYMLGCVHGRDKEQRRRAKR